MSDLIKKIKIKKQDGTFTDYIPIGADAQNVKMNNNYSVEDNIGNINIEENGSIAEQLDKIQIKNKKIFPNLGGVTYISNINNWNNDVKKTYQEFYDMGGRKAQISQSVYYSNNSWNIGDLNCLRTAIEDIKHMGYNEIMVKLHPNRFIYNYDNRRKKKCFK